MEKNRKKSIFNYFFIIILCFSLYAGIAFISLKFMNYVKATDEYDINIEKKGLGIKDINILDKKENEIEIRINLSNLIIKKERYVLVTDTEQLNTNDEWIIFENNSAKIVIKNDSKYIYIRDDFNNLERYEVKDYINEVLNFKVNLEDRLLYIGEEYELNFEISKIGNPDDTIDVNIENNSIVTYENNKLKAISNGKTKVNVMDKFGHNYTATIYSTNLISQPKIDDYKPFLRDNQYSLEDARLLDEILAFNIGQKKDKTRAAVVEAARFLSLQFKYKVPYFLENGRLQQKSGYAYVDGEGRYYHKGLYLSYEKYDSIVSSFAGKAIWGKAIMEYSNDRYMPNGLDCSGFVCWCLVNGGFDPGDIGSGPNYGFDVLTDYGKSQYISWDLLNSQKVKAGDLIGFDGHIGIIIGVEKGYIYVADTILYERGVCATKYSYYDLIYNSDFTNIYDMSNYYLDDGNYSDMW